MREYFPFSSSRVSILLLMTTETALLESLGITDPAQQQGIISGQLRLLLLDASAHMDWDWLLPFPVLNSGQYSGNASNSRASWYFHAPSGNDPGVGPVNQILPIAQQQLVQHTNYRYSVCETGFLRGFALADPKGYKALLASAKNGTRFRSEGGGITSPDNLLPHGEAFIRNYLEGQYWVSKNSSGVPSGTACWIPDDFGHDPQLPVAAEAMGLVSAGFERIPGTNGIKPLNGSQTMVEMLTDDKIDFNWTAADGSSLTAHWLISKQKQDGSWVGGYGQGNDIASTADIASYLDMNLKPSPTPYIYVPVLSDFSLPNTNLTNVVQQWNARSTSDLTIPYPNVIAVCGSFEVYGQLLQFHKSQLDASYGKQFNANPFWTGCYGSRPAIKILHQRAARNLLAAEVFSIIANKVQIDGGSSAVGTGNTYAGLLSDAWNILAPSTHHDYITGTAIPDVYHTEQMILLRQADERAEKLRNDTMHLIAGAITLPQYQTSQAVAVFNPQGFARTGVVEVSGTALKHAGFPMPANGAQVSADGNLLFSASVPSLGYQTVFLNQLSLPSNTSTVTPSTNPVTGNSVVLANGLVTATLTRDGNGFWGLTSVIDQGTKKELVPADTIMNQLLFYADGGDEYRFGMEEANAWTYTDVSKSLSNPTISIVESGPLRVTVRTGFTYDDDKVKIQYTQDYILQANEPMLRFRTTGAAPLLQAANYDNGAAVVVGFPLLDASQSIDTLVRGTPNHWTDLMPTLYWNDQTFMPTHNFVIPRQNKQSLCAIYHSDIPAWGLSNQVAGSNSSSNTLYGCLFRNGDGHYYNWVQPQLQWPFGTDPDQHVRNYALRMPSTLGTPESGSPLQEALAFADPLQGVPVFPWTAELPDQLSLATSNNPATIVIVMKPGTYAPEQTVLRVYQPSNTTQSVTLTLSNLLNSSEKKLNVVAQTALEKNLDAVQKKPLAIKTTTSTIQFKAVRALTTLAIKP